MPTSSSLGVPIARLLDIRDLSPCLIPKVAFFEVIEIAEELVQSDGLFGLGFRGRCRRCWSEARRGDNGASIPLRPVAVLGAISGRDNECDHDCATVVEIVGGVEVGDMAVPHVLMIEREATSRSVRHQSRQQYLPTPRSVASAVSLLFIKHKTYGLPGTCTTR